MAASIALKTLLLQRLWDIIFLYTYQIETNSRFLYEEFSFKLKIVSKPEFGKINFHREETINFVSIRGENPDVLKLIQAGS